MHTFFMRRCLELAEIGRGKTGINPMVGAVLVRDGVITAEGFHHEFGKAHAELELLQKFEQKIYSNDTLYVNLEPCCHRNKKTPPCTDIMIKSGFKHVVFGMRDPNPAVAGRGIEALRKAGIEVIGPVLEDECLRLNRGFVSMQKNLRPWITLKIARTVDGRIANEDGSMMKITDDKQNAWSHEFLRARHDAILVGVGTIITDHSRLTIRSAERKREAENIWQPYRIIFDAQLRMPLTETVVTDRHVVKTIIVCSSHTDVKKKSELERRGVQVVECPVVAGEFDWTVLWKMLTTPKDSFYGISSILVEGGGKTWKSFRNPGIVDQEITLLGS